MRKRVCRTALLEMRPRATARGPVHGGKPPQTGRTSRRRECRRRARSAKVENTPRRAGNSIVDAGGKSARARSRPLRVVSVRSTRSASSEDPRQRLPRGAKPGDCCSARREPSPARDVLPARPVGVGDRSQHLPEAGSNAAARAGVRAAKRTAPARREEDRHRHEPCTRNREDGVHVEASTSGRSSRVDLELDEGSFISSAVSGLERSCSITWHQWHAAEADGEQHRFVLGAGRARTPRPHAYKSTGLRVAGEVWGSSPRKSFPYCRRYPLG